MFRNYLSAAWGDLRRSPVQSFIAIGGLAIGLWAAILAGLVIVNQISYDHFLPGYERIYMATVKATLGGRPPDYFPYTPHDEGARLAQDFPEIEAMSRFKSDTSSLRHGDIEASETLYNADPNIFALLPLPVLYGNLSTALARPDSIVIPRAIARKYFGRDNVVGQTLELDRQHPLKITAVIADLPVNGTILETAIFTSAHAAYSPIVTADRNPTNARNGNFGLDLQTVVRLKPGTNLTALQNRMLSMSEALLPRPDGIAADLYLMRPDQMHLSEFYSPGIRDRLAAFGVIAILILFLSSVNFINLSTARATQRGVEVGVRKAVGAGRPALIMQFLGESILQMMLALCLALAAAEWALPAVNAFLNSGAVLDYWRNPVLIAILLLSTAAVGVLAGAYPAFVMSSFRPATVLKGLMTGSAKGGSIRQILVILQFAVLVLLAIAAWVVFEQHSFAVNQNQKMDTDQTLFVNLRKCEGPFKDAVAALPGVRAVACSDNGFIRETNYALIPRANGPTTGFYLAGAAPGLFELYGQHPVAGRSFRPTDAITDATIADKAASNVVINETAVKRLGFASDQAAIGQVLHPAGLGPTVVIGVVKDFSVFALENKIDATAYRFRVRSGPDDALLHIKLKGDDIPATLAAIDVAWNRSGATGPIQRAFMNGYIAGLHLPLLRESQAFAVFAGIAMLLGCLGLFGLSISTAERRTKEIGVRKVMGASTVNILTLLLWQFAKPVLVANLIAWPLAWWAMERWLSGFAYHIDLPLWIFPTASLGALAIAIITVTGQTVIVALQKPVLALRYE